MNRKVKCTINDLIVLANQLTEFQTNAEKESLILSAPISYIIHKNEQLIMQRYSRYEQSRIKLLRKFIEFDATGKPVMVETGEGEQKTSKPKFIDEKKFDAEFNKLLKKEIEVEFYMPINIENKIEDMKGEQKTLNQIWYLLEIFETWDPANKVEMPDELIQSESEAEQNTSEVKITNGNVEAEQLGEVNSEVKSENEQANG